MNLTFKHPYRAGNHVKLGKVDEHAYNMFISVMHQWWNLRLFNAFIREARLHTMFERVVHPIRVRALKEAWRGK